MKERIDVMNEQRLEVTKQLDDVLEKHSGLKKEKAQLKKSLEDYKKCTVLLKTKHQMELLKIM